METARGSYEHCRQRAAECRIAASRHAKRGNRNAAIYLTSQAQEYDRRAEEWRKNVPAWQWSIDWNSL